MRALSEWKVLWGAAPGRSSTGWVGGWVCTQEGGECDRAHMAACRRTLAGVASSLMHCGTTADAFPGSCARLPASCPPNPCRARAHLHPPPPTRVGGCRSRAPTTPESVAHRQSKPVAGKHGVGLCTPLSLLSTTVLLPCRPAHPPHPPAAMPPAQPTAAGTEQGRCQQVPDSARQPAAAAAHLGGVQVLQFPSLGAALHARQRLQGVGGAGRMTREGWSGSGSCRWCVPAPRRPPSGAPRQPPEKAPACSSNCLQAPRRRSPAALGALPHLRLFACRHPAGHPPTHPPTHTPPALTGSPGKASGGTVSV